ncbi:uncharacterized protein LY89DRAFT_753194 [Mollisia scopiformis]|uniref:Uncharacterized protein n=1 Tax=Mollisia scopiformis TaxID=149040 RepID=A0A194X104_MOLSC|nr:uncharacterized protein LY89DRAFT_753194 [Mollisia scopiformis]KUJ13873.1 hypothetical protein LY89DRAFT_753194 [Mollisia scopiformis]
MATANASQGSVTPKNHNKSPFPKLKRTFKKSKQPDKTKATLPIDLPSRSLQDAVPQISHTPELHLTELWDAAYEELKSSEKKLIDEYEENLRGDLTTMLGATESFSGLKIERKDLMRQLLTQKIAETKENTWKLKFGEHKIPVKDLAEPVIGIIRWADDYISGALSANPYASIAWAGVYDIWKDTREQEAQEKVYRQHKENSEAMGTISWNLVSLQMSIDARQRETCRSDLLDWLSSVDPSKNYNNALRTREDGTGNWLLKSRNFKDWEIGRRSLLWSNGKGITLSPAGSGKSILSASIIEHLREAYGPNPETALAYFYFSFNDGKKQNVVEALSSIVKQLCCRRPDTPEAVEALRQYKTSGQRPDQKTLEKTLDAVLHGFTHVHIVLDALDECPSDDQARHNLLETIGRVLASEPDNLHLLLTSRREVDIEKALIPALSNASSDCFSIDINVLNEQEALETDITFHIDHEFNTEPFCSWPPDIKEEVKSALINNADGMFQYVACQFNDLRLHGSRATIRAALRNLPKGLDDTYDRMLQGVAPQYQQRVAGVLKWLAFSLRPLTLDEVAEAFILDPEKEVPFDEDERIFNVLTHLTGLVIQVPIGDDGDPQIQLAHFSIKEYLCCGRMTLKHFSAEEESSHLYLAKSCLAYHLQLSSERFATTDTMKPYALWDYAARAWTLHLEKVKPQTWTDHLIREATGALSAGSQSLFNMIRISDPDEEWEGLNEDENTGSLSLPLYCTASWGLYQLTSLLIRNGAGINDVSETSARGTALHAAAYHEHDEIAILLLANQADVNIVYEGMSALQLAAASCSQTTVQVLLDHGADIGIEGGYTYTR